MTLAQHSSSPEAWGIAIARVAALALTALVAGSAMARAEEAVAPTQAGARVSFTSLEDWNLQAENLSPRGRNPLTLPLEPGFRYILERPDDPRGRLRVEVKVLDETEPFDVPGIGKFECAVVQEEEFHDGVFAERALNWFCIDTTTGNVYAFGEASWETDPSGREVFSGAWRAGEPDSNGITEPGLLMPKDFVVGDRYLFEGPEAESYGYAENMERGVTVTTAAGTFKNCVRTRATSLGNPAEVTDRWWCPGVGLVKEQPGGELVASDALPGTDMSSFGKHRPEGRPPAGVPVARISREQAQEIALKAVPGKVTSVEIEQRGRHRVYAVEIRAKQDGVETDVFVDVETGKVVGTER